MFQRQLSPATRSEEHTSELQSRLHLVCRLLLEKKKNSQSARHSHHHTVDTDSARPHLARAAHPHLPSPLLPSSVFFFNDTATTEIYTLSLHDALPIWSPATSLSSISGRVRPAAASSMGTKPGRRFGDRKSTRLNSSHGYISYAVF